MANDYKELVGVLPRGVWMRSDTLDRAWKLKSGSGRKYRVKMLMENGYLLRRGKTSHTQYRVADKNFKPDPEPVSKPTSQPGSLNELINAVTKVGTENELLKKGLIEIQTIVNRTLLTL